MSRRPGSSWSAASTTSTSPRHPGPRRRSRPVPKSAGEPMHIKSIAAVCHEANRAYCEEVLDDDSNPLWEDAPEWQIVSACAGVKFRQENPDAPDAAQHGNWMRDKLADGWVYGKEKDEEKK